MNLFEIIASLKLPTNSLAEKRVSKKLLLENVALTSSDRRLINDNVDDMIWLAALKPTNIGVPEFRDETREYLEIAVLQLTLKVEGVKAGARESRLLELIHRAIPYPLLLITQKEKDFNLSVAHKRWSQAEADKIILEGGLIVANFNSQTNYTHWQFFCQSLALSNQPNTSLNAFYQGWIDRILAFHASRLTGKFETAASPEIARLRQESLLKCARLESEISRLRSLAKKEKQMARQIDLNLELKGVEASLATTKQKL